MDMHSPLHPLMQRQNRWCTGMHGTTTATVPLTVIRSENGLLETVMRSIHSMGQTFRVSHVGGAANGWASRPIALFRHQIMRYRLRQRLATCGISMPLLRHYSVTECGEIERALVSLCLPDGVRTASDCWSALVAPCISGDRDGFMAVLTLIRHALVKPNRVGPEGDALLHVIAREGRVVAPGMGRVAGQHVDVEDRVRLLVASGADPDQSTAFGPSALQLAWERTSLMGERIAGALLEAGCNPMKRDNNGETLLHRAARTNNLAVLRGWRKVGLDLNPTGGLREGQALLQTPLMFAVMAGCRGSIELLIEKKCDQFAASSASIDLVDRYGATALHWAVDYDRLELADLLRGSGADPSIHAGRDGLFCWTPEQLMSARRMLRPGCPILRLLLKYRVYPEQPLRALGQSGWNKVRRIGFCRHYHSIHPRLE